MRLPWIGGADPKRGWARALGRISAALVIAGLLGVRPLEARPKEVPLPFPDQIQVELSVRADGPALWADLVFVAQRPDGLDRRKACLDGRMMEDEFVIETRGRRVRYRGASGRRVASPTDFLLIRAGQPVRARVRLDEHYQFPRGSRTYRVQYVSTHSTPFKPRLDYLRSNKVEVTFNR